MTKLLFPCSFLFCSFLIAHPEMAKETQTTAEYQAIEVLALLDESLFDLVSSGISRVNFANVHTELLALQPRLLSYSTST